MLSLLKGGAKVRLFALGKKQAKSQNLLIKDEVLIIILFAHKNTTKNKILFPKIIVTFVHLVCHITARQTGFYLSTLCMNGKDQLRAQVSNPDGCRAFVVQSDSWRPNRLCKGEIPGSGRDFHRGFFPGFPIHIFLQIMTFVALR